MSALRNIEQSTPATGSIEVFADRPSVSVRAIEETDLDIAIGLLRLGFADRSEAYWRKGLERHGAQQLPDGVPRYGYLIEKDGKAVGVLLALYRAIKTAQGTHLRCNLSSWYVKPEFRSLGTLLDGYAMRDRTVTYVNVSPAPQTWQMHLARGFKSFCGGQMLVLPALSSRTRNVGRVRAASPASLALLSEAEARLVADHVSYGCIGLVCSKGTDAGAVVFQRRALKIFTGRLAWLTLPTFQLAYHSPGLDLAACSGALGRHLLTRHAMPWFVIDAMQKLPGLAGRFFPGRAPKYARGPNPPATGDLSYTEIVLFGA